MKTELDRSRVADAFRDYVAAYDASDPKIKLKIDHTLRVASLCQKIAEAAGADTDLSWLSGMLHDIGRFEQVRRYNTFVDSLSVDHAMLGADLLFREGLLERFCTQMTAREREILEKAIRNHSAYRLSEDLNEEEILYCNVLRDADKIDIYRVNCDTPREQIYNFTTQELISSPVCDEVKACFENRTAVLRSLKKYPADYITGHICLAFELVFPISRKIVREQGYLTRLLTFESENPDTREWFAHMRSVIENE